jgi:predicted RNase H-like nuclease (RuvC/YqgF family)
MPYQWVAPDDTPTPQTTGLVEILNRDQLLAEVSRLREDLEYIQSHYQREIENGEKKMGWLREKTAQIVEAEAEVSRLQQENALLKRSLGVLTEECQKWQEEAELAAGAIDELIIKHRDDDTVIERATERLTEAYQTIEELEGRLVVQGQSIEHYQARLKDLEPAEADESKSRH